MALQHIQRRLTRYYRIELVHEVDNFICDDVTAERWTGETARGEVLIVAEYDEELRVGLFVDEDVLRAISRGGDCWLDGRAQASALATEGVSHFVYLMFRANRDEKVSQLELELQAEVDKYLLALAPREGRTRHQLVKRSRMIRMQLFHGQRFIDDEGSERGERYRLAHRIGARYAKALEDKFVCKGNVVGLKRELGYFYRGGLRRKLEMAS